MVSKLRLSAALFALLIMLGSIAGMALAKDEVDPAAIIGPYCFTLDNYADTWHWQVDAMPRNIYQVTGYDEIIGTTAMTGGGYRSGNMMYLQVSVTIASTGWRAVHAIELNLSTFTGTTDFTWYDQTGAPAISYTNEPFHLTSCTVKAISDKPYSCPLPAGVAPVPVDPALVGTKALTGWQCFTLDSFIDTWHLFFVSLGGGAHQVTGYDDAYTGSAIHGGGFQVGDHLFLVMNESFQTGGERCTHAIDLNLRTMTGTTTLIWKDYAEVPYVSYFQLPFSQCAKQADTAGQVPSNPRFTGLPVAEQPTDDGLDLKAILGNYCFSLDNWADTWFWTIDQVATGIYEVTGFDSYYGDCAINGGGWRSGNKVYLSVQSVITGSGQRCFIAIDFDLTTKTGVADFTWTYTDGTLPLSYLDEPFSMIACGSKAAGLAPSSGREPAPEKVRGPILAAADLTVGAAPNPFNPMTTISFKLPQAGNVELGVYDISGRLVRSLLSGSREAGDHQVVWDGRDASGRQAASGVYFAVLASGDQRASSRLVMLK